MKKICLMSGAYKNAGDFLIEKRTCQLLKENILDTDISIYKRDKDFSDSIDILNGFDLIVFGGGPFYQNNIYPMQIPFVKELFEIKVPVVFLGGGGYNFLKNSFTDKNLFDTQTKIFFSVNEDIPLGCRDWPTYHNLQNEGFSNLIMTGCPAWYDLDNINNTDFCHHDNEKMKICISEPARPENIFLLEELIKFLRVKYKEADIHLIIHRDRRAEFDRLFDNNFCYKYRIKVTDISGSADGFSIYDNCDLHIGFRVHAHIYNLSKRNKTLLINEDFRGFAVNETLGLPQIDIDTIDYKYVHLIKSYFIAKHCNTQNLETMKNVIKKIDFALDESESTSWYKVKQAFSAMKYYYENMKKFICLFD